jgi:hypothetical protein
VVAGLVRRKCKFACRRANTFDDIMTRLNLLFVYKERDMSLAIDCTVMNATHMNFDVYTKFFIFDVAFTLGVPF